MSLSKWLISYKGKNDDSGEIWQTPTLAQGSRLTSQWQDKPTCVPLNEMHQEGYHLCGLPAKRAEPESDHEKTIRQTEIWDSQQCNWLSKNVNVKKEKEKNLKEDREM